jgi:hypothetical protein
MEHQGLCNWSNDIIVFSKFGESQKKLFTHEFIIGYF